MAKSNVTQFAEELKLPVALLLEQLGAAGVKKKAGDDAITEQDKTRLLDYLREHARQQGREEEDHAHAQADHGDQEVRRDRQGAHHPGRGAQEAHVREGGQGRADPRAGEGGPAARARHRRAGSPQARGRGEAPGRARRAPGRRGRDQGQARDQEEGGGRGRRGAARRRSRPAEAEGPKKKRVVRKKGEEPPPRPRPRCWWR